MATGLQESLVLDLENLYDDHSTADLEFVTGAVSDGSGQGGKLERIRAHRLIVLFRCRRYWSKKQQWLAANLPMVTVRLEWTAPDTAKRVVRYLYTGQVRRVVNLLLLAAKLSICFVCRSKESHFLHSVVYYFRSLSFVAFSIGACCTVATGC